MEEQKDKTKKTECIVCKEGWGSYKGNYDALCNKHYLIAEGTYEGDEKEEECLSEEYEDLIGNLTTEEFLELIKSQDLMEHIAGVMLDLFNMGNKETKEEELKELKEWIKSIRKEKA
jgi:hypothetical protein